MTNRHTRELERFVVRDENGNEFEAIISQEFLASKAMGRETQWIPGMKSLRLSNGEPLNFVDEATFVRVSSGKVLKRDQ